MTGDHEAPGEGLLDWVTKEEPVMAGALGVAIASGGLNFVVEHGYVTSTQASGATQVVTTAVTAGVAIVIGFLVRRLVKPMAKLIDGNELAKPTAPPTTTPTP